MGDRLLASKLSRYVTGHLVQLNLSSPRGREIEYRPLTSVFACVWLQVCITVFPLWQVTPRSSEMELYFS